MIQRLTLFLMLLTSCLNMVLSAESKIAIVGDSTQADKVAAMVLTKLSVKDNIAILERGEIDKLLREHKLTRSGMTAAQLASFARIAHVDVFAVINSAKDGKKNVVSSLLVFDAKSGFKLRDIRLADKLEDDVKTTIQAVETALAQLRDSKKLNYVAVLAVRNAGVPLKYKYKLENIAEEVQRRLVASPKIAVLERSRLGLVNKERKLTGKQYWLLSSAYLLDFEFSQGHDSNTVNLKFHVLLPNGKIMHSYFYPNCLNEPESHIKKMVSVLKIFLGNDIPENIASAAAEARRYINEARLLPPSSEALQKAETAVALAPDNPDYRMRLLRIKSSWLNKTKTNSPDKRFELLIENGRQLLKDAKAARADFPQYKRSFWDFGIETNMWFTWRNNVQLISEKQKKEAQNFIDKLRSFCLTEHKRYWSFDLSDGINSQKKLKSYVSYLTHFSEPYFYLDNEKFMKALIEKKVEILELYEEFSRKHKPVTPNISYFYEYQFGPKDFFRIMNNHLRCKLMLKLVKMLKANPGVKNREFGYVLEMMRNNALKDHSATHLSKQMDKLLPQLYKLYNGQRMPLLLISGSPMYMVKNYYEGRGAPRGLYRVIQSKRDEFISTKASEGNWNKVLGQINQAKTKADKAKIIIANKNYLHRWRRANNTDNRIDFREHPAFVFKEFDERVNYLAYGKDENAKLYLQALDYLNAPLKVKLVTRLFPLGEGDVLSAVEYKGMIYLLTYEKKGEKIVVYCFDPATEEVSKFSAQQKTAPLNRIKTRFKRRVFFVNDGYFMIADFNRVIVISRNSGTVYTISDLPGKYVHALTVMNKRIYLFCSNNRGHTEFLFSCRIKGKGRQIHLSTLRRGKQHILEKHNELYTSNIFADPAKQRLLFQCGAKKGGLWEFSPKNNSFKQLFAVASCNDLWSEKIAGKIYIADGPLHCGYFVYDIDSDIMDFAFMNNRSAYLKKMGIKEKQPRYIQRKSLNITPPFYLKGKHLWTGGYKVKLVDFKKTDGMYYVYGIDYGIGPASYHPVFPHHDGRSVYTFSRRSIYQITPPPEGGKKENK